MNYSSYFLIFSKSNGGCGAEFCWLCLERWSTHGEGSGKNFILVMGYCNYTNHDGQARQ